MSGKPNIQEFDIKVPGAVSDEAWQTDKLSPEDQERKAEIDRVLDPVESMKDRKDTKDLTLEEIKARDEDNLKLVQDSSQWKSFDSPNKAVGFIGTVYKRAMLKLGITAFANYGTPMPESYKGLTSIPGGLYIPGPSAKKAMENLVTKQLIENDVRIEGRGPDMYPEDKDHWKIGLYFYHASEIVFFISRPIPDKDAMSGAGHIVMPHSSPQRWWVRTNVPGL
ncbi:MAG: hypothetical protein ABIJ57_08685 [Pseudomonadota bacterium]